MDQTLYYLFICARPRQWLKNISLFTGIIFSGWLFIGEKFLAVCWAFLIFSLLASAVYILNDIIDAPQDRLHPIKKHRPIASNKLPIPVAIFAFISLILIVLFLSFSISFFFFFLVLVYLILQIAYTFWLKRINILDVMTIASGFILRVYVGAVAINSHINSWLLLCIISFALFLAIGKRRSEKTILESHLESKPREVLSHYPDNLLNIYTAMFATTTWLSYALFTFQQTIYIERGQVLTFMSFLPKTFINQKLLMFTIPLVIYGVMRYLQLIYDRNQGESPEKVLLADKPLLSTVFLWGLFTIAILYFI
ncbi:UbiA prenyltransferase family protein [Candidatus Beckwithbacteria bacterium]|nr:UbiA prenyltransferase family protein [Candidatus Beckwithbacteria bacterium]